MSGSKRALLVAVILTAALVAPSTALAAASDEDITDVPISVTALTAADLVERLTPTDATFTGITASESADSSPVKIQATSASAWFFDGPVPAFIETWVAESSQAVSGPQGTLFGRNAITTRGTTDPAFYSTRPEVTAYLAKVDPLPEFTDEEIFEISLAFTWAQDEVLTSSPFDYEPLLDYGNVVSFGWLAGQEFDNYAKVIDQQWTQFGNSVLRFDFTDTAGDYYVGFLLPGIPEAAGFTLSYADQPTPERMIAQHIPVTTPADLFTFPGLEATYGDLDPGLQDAVVGFRETVGAEDPEAVAPPPEEEDPPPVDPEPAVTDTEEPAQDPPTVEEETPPLGDAQGTGTDNTSEDSSSGIPPWLYGLFFIILLALIWFILRSFIGRRQPPSEPPPPGSIASQSAAEVAPAEEAPDATALGLGVQRLITTRNDQFVDAINTAHAASGGPSSGDWIAPTYQSILDGGVETAVDPDLRESWAQVFINTQTREWVTDADPRFGGLVMDLGLPAPDPGPALIDWGGPPGSEVDITTLEEPSEPEPFHESEEMVASLRRRRQVLLEPKARGIVELHNRIGGLRTEDGWTAPTNQTAYDGIATNALAPEPGRGQEWSGFFLNDITFEWVFEDDPGWAELIERTGVQAPTEFGEAIGFDDMMGPIS